MAEKNGATITSTAPPTVNQIFSWHEISFSIAQRAKPRQILKCVDGRVENGSLCAIIGPSGSGKTSLLNILAGRIRNKGNTQVSGTVLVNGKQLSNRALRRRLAYVIQADLLVPTHTPREALRLSAALRLPRATSAAEKSAIVERMIELLGLTRCADTLTGDEIIRGISGGEKKRTSIGIELVMQPSLLFLDEPTSGLDSYAAYQVVVTLKHLAGDGCNVICTIHQPSSEIFHTFDQVTMLRAGGHLPLYSGGVKELSPLLTSAGHGCPQDFNLADHALFLIQTLTDDALDTLRENLLAGSGSAGMSVDAVRASVAEDSVVAPRPTARLVTQTVYLSQRELLGFWRNKPGLIATVLSPVLLNLLFACIFYRAGDTNRSGYSLMSHFGAITQIAIGGMFGAAQPLLLKFPLERGIFLREYATTTYSVAAYFFSKMLVELPQGFLIALLTYLVSYWLIALNGSFILYVLIFWISGIAASSTALLAGSLSQNAEVAVQLAPAIFVPQLLFAGFFIQSEQIPVWLRWAQYLCGLKYAMNLFTIIEFGSAATEGESESYRNQTRALLDANDVDEDLWWVYLLIILATTASFRMLSLFVLSRRAAATF